MNINYYRRAIIDFKVPNVIFVFGSNEAGIHGAGAAVTARKLYGAQYGHGSMLFNDSYGITTKDRNLVKLPLRLIEMAIAQFVEYSIINSDLDFLITKVGCGLAGYRDSEIAPLFNGIGDNCAVHVSWIGYLKADSFTEVHI